MNRLLSKTLKQVLVVGLALAVPPLVIAADSTASHAFSIHDMLDMQRISDVQVTSSGELVIFTLRTTDLDANRGRTDLWQIRRDGSGLRQLTTHEASDFHPRLSADGRSIFFLSTRSGTAQIWRLPLNGGEAQPVTDLPLDVGSFAVSPAGKQLVLSMEVFPDCDSIDCTVSRLKTKADNPASGLVYDKLLVRHWDTWKDGRRSHLFAMKSDGTDSPRDLMPGMDADCPSKPFGGPEEYSIHPDGSVVVFSARDVGSEEAWSTNFDLYRVPLDGLSKPVSITASNKAWDTQPLFSPDGKTLAYLAMERPGFESDRLRIVLQSWPGGDSRTLTQDWDRSISGMTWSADGKTIYATASDLGQRALFAVNARSGERATVVGEGTVRSVSIAGDELIFGLDHLRSPVELYATRKDGSGVRRITRINDERVRAARMGQAEQFNFKGWNGETVYGYVVQPVDFDPNKSYPVAFLIHGGPQGSFGNDFHYRWNPQAYTGAGFAAVMIDFHGSVGYGQEFTDSIREDWGGKPLEDLQKGLAAALKKYSWLDGDRVVALGASYGGYMINWIAGNWPDRFRALVNHDGNLDELMAYYNTEELWFPEWERRGTPWEVPEAYQKHSPIHKVKNWKTPMLVIHSALDYRVVDTQGIATFTALQRRGIPSKLLYFPDENHWILKPQNSIQWHDTVLGWLKQWTDTAQD